MKKALILGVTGQDGTYLAELLLEKIILYMVSNAAPLYLIPIELIIYIKIRTPLIAILSCIMAI